MFTVYYKGFYINCYCDEPRCRIVHDTITPRDAKSLHAAKCWITRHTKTYK